MNIDSHQHFWRYSEAQYPWIQADWPLRRDFLPSHLASELAACGMEGSVAVQARQSVEETRWLVQLARDNPSIVGVVGWVDLCSDRVEEALEEWAVEPKLAGVRHVVQDEPDDRFMCRKDFQRGVGQLRQHGLTYDILVYPHQLPAALELVRAFPDQPMVLDHLAKPGIREGHMSPWREHIRELAQAPQVMCKVSGMVTEADWANWSESDFMPYLEVVREHFGLSRLMYGSDWPVCLLAGSYAQVHALARRAVEGCNSEDQAKFFGGNAARFYGIGR